MHPIPPVHSWADLTLAHRLLEWLNANSLAVQAAATVILIVLTGYYAVITHHLLKQARQSAQAASEQASAALRQAEAAEKTLAHLKHEHEGRLNLSAQIVSEAITDTKAVVASWKIELEQAHTLPLEPKAGTTSLLEIALVDARVISPPSARKLREAITALREAEQETTQLQAAIESGFQSQQVASSAAAEVRLKMADQLLTQATDLLGQGLANATARAL